MVSIVAPSHVGELYSVDDDLIGACTCNLGAHRITEISQISDFRILSGVFNYGLTFRQNCGQHDVFSSAIGRAIQVDSGSYELFGRGVHVAVLTPDFGSESLETALVQINSSFADCASARKADTLA